VLTAALADWLVDSQLRIQNSTVKSTSGFLEPIARRHECTVDRLDEEKRTDESLIYVIILIYLLIYIQ